MYKLIGFLSLLCFMTAQCLIHCEKNACESVKCDCFKYDDCKKPNQDVRRGGLCRCCFICYTTLGEHERCPPYSIGGSPPTSGCGKGLICKDGICQKEK